MCLRLLQINSSIIATEDIKVVKVGFIHKELFTPTWRMHFHYTEGVLTDKVELVVQTDETQDGPYIAKGYHSYDNIQNVDMLLHKHVMRARGLKLAIGNFIIPKGTKYYQSGHEIVSEQIIYKGLHK